MAAFSFRLYLAKEVSRHFLVNERGDLSFFFLYGINKFLSLLNERGESLFLFLNVSQLYIQRLKSAYCFEIFKFLSYSSK